MATQIKTQITINAPAQKVWEVFSNFNNYFQWNPFIKSLTGKVSVGETIKVVLEQPGKKPMVFKPQVLKFEPGKQLTWLGHLLVPGIFDGEHTFILIDNGNNSTTFIQSESFKGILVPFLKKMLENNTVKGFESMNNKLKELAEAALVNAV